MKWWWWFSYHGGKQLFRFTAQNKKRIRLEEGNLRLSQEIEKMRAEAAAAADCIAPAQPDPPQQKGKNSYEICFVVLVWHSTQTYKRIVVLVIVCTCVLILYVLVCLCTCKFNPLKRCRLLSAFIISDQTGGKKTIGGSSRGKGKGRKLDKLFVSFPFEIYVKLLR